MWEVSIVSVRKSEVVENVSTTSPLKRILTLNNQTQKQKPLSLTVCMVYKPQLME